MTNRTDLPADWIAALEVLSERIGLPMVRVSAGRAACGRVVRDNTPKIDTSIRSLRAAMPADRIAAIGDAMIERAASIVSERVKVSAEAVRSDMEDDATKTPVKSTIPVRRIDAALSEIRHSYRDDNEGQIEALIVFMDVLAA